MVLSKSRCESFETGCAVAWVVDRVVRMKSVLN